MVKVYGPKTVYIVENLKHMRACTRQAVSFKREGRPGDRGACSRQSTGARNIYMCWMFIRVQMNTASIHPSITLVTAEENSTPKTRCS